MLDVQGVAARSAAVVATVAVSSRAVVVTAAGGEGHEGGEEGGGAGAGDVCHGLIEPHRLSVRSRAAGTLPRLCRDDAKSALVSCAVWIVA